MTDAVIKEMVGHSGCKLYLCQEGGKKYVRKVSSSVTYNNRLELQMKKQDDFSDSVLKAPEVYGSGYVSDLFFFDMEFVSGVPLHNYISLNSIDNIIPLIKKIFNFLQQIPVSHADISSDIENKIHNLRKSIPSSMSRHCDYCLDYDWSDIPQSQNHGDLTFENVLIYRNQIYFIDFLDSFVETKYVDYGKLLMDVVLMWSWRLNEKAPFIKNMHLYDRFLEILSHSEIQMIRRFLVLGLLRIVLYSDKKALKFLENKLKYIEKRFNL